MRGAAQKGSGLGTGRCNPRLLSDPPFSAISIPHTYGWLTSMPNDHDLFAEEQSMVTMSFGEHIEELRVRLILALIGLFVGVIIVFVPPLDIGWRVMKQMEKPAKDALDAFYSAEYKKKAELAQEKKSISPRVQAVVDADVFVTELRKIAPKLELPDAETLKGTYA